MFSVAEKQRIAQVIEDLLREINHPEMDITDIRFTLKVEGKELWSWAEIVPNRLATPNPNPIAAYWNERA
jgi:hypothetical protein